MEVCYRGLLTLGAILVFAPTQMGGCGTSGTNSDLAAPSGLTARASSNSEIDLTWTNNTLTADVIDIERSGDGVNFAPLVTLNGQVNHYSDLNLTPTTTLFYRVKIHSGSLFSDYSNIASGTTPP